MGMFRKKDRGISTMKVKPYEDPDMEEMEIPSPPKSKYSYSPVSEERDKRAKLKGEAEVTLEPKEILGLMQVGLHDIDKKMIYIAERLREVNEMIEVLRENQE